MRLRLLILAVAFGLTASGCASAASSGDGRADETPRPTLASPPPPVAPGREEAEPGPTRLDGPVPGGYARTPEGAVAAATTYLSVLHVLVAEDATVREEALKALGARGAPDVVADTLSGLAALDEQRGRAEALASDARVWLREVPVAFHLDAFASERASVAVWSVGVVLVEGVTEGTEVWSTNAVELVWERGDWRVWAWSRTDGPVPVTATPPDATPPSEFLDRLQGWEGYRYVPGL